MRGLKLGRLGGYWGACVLLSISQVAAQSQSLPKLDLIWRSGEQVPGELVGAGPDGVVFHPLGQTVFATPVSIALPRVDELRINAPDTAREEPFMLLLRDGGRLLADQITLSGATLSLKSGWLGDFQIQREAVAAVARVRGDAMVFVAPGPGVRWTESLKLEQGNANPLLPDPFAPADQVLKVRRVQGGRGQRNPDGSPMDRGELQLWHALPTGSLRTESWNNTLSAPLREADLPVLPLRLRMDFHLSADQKPAFALKIEQETRAVQVETWQDRLVLRQGSRFAAVPAGTELADYRLTLLWNRENHEAQLLTHDGQLLAQLPALRADDPLIDHTQTKLARNPQQGSVPRPALPTLSLENLGADLALHAVSITLWKGGSVEAAPAERGHARLLSGKVLKGEWLKADENGIVIKNEEGTEQTAAWDEVLAITTENGGAEPVLGKGPLVQLRSAADEGLTATFVNIEPAEGAGSEMQLRLRTAAAQGELRARLAATAQIRFLEEEPVLEQPESEPVLRDRLTVGNHTLRGDLVAVGEPMPRWRFDGAKEPTPLSPALQAMLRRDPKLGTSTDRLPSAALLQLKAGDLVPITLKQVNAEALSFTSPSLLRTTLAAADVTAILFPGPPLITQGFRDPGWQQLAGDQPVLKADSPEEITLQPGDVLGHPSMMEGEGVEFTLHENADQSPSSLNLTLYTRGLESDDDSLRVTIAFVGDELYCGEGMAEGQLRRQGQMPKPGGPVHVTVLVREGQVSVRINGGEVVNFPVQTTQRVGMGMLLAPGALWGNQPQSLRLSAFSAVAQSQNLRVPQVADEVRTHALTIPRARAEEPPHHLLIGPNGDVLRGTVERVEAGQLHLRWGLENLAVPQDRVAALVLLEPAVSNTDKAIAAVDVTSAARRPTLHWLLLRDGGRFGLNLERWAEDGVVGQHPLLGRVRVANDAVLALHAGQPPPALEAMRAVSGWVLQNAVQPEIPEDTAPVSPLVSTEAKPLALPLVGGGEFVLQEQRGKVVVLDFWATWCGPCLKALPELMDAFKDLPSDQVKLVGVNQAEQEETVRAFLETRNWNLVTVLDADQAAGRQFGVESIPHTVVVGPDGKIELVKTGHTSTAAKEIADKVRELLRTK